MKRLWLLLIVICLGCDSKPPLVNINISLINNGQSLGITTGMDPLVLGEISRDTANKWQSLAPVYRMPADTSLKNYMSAQPGIYQLKNNALVFTPDTPFVKQQTYFLRFYNYAGNKSIWDYIRGKSQPGRLHFTELIFKQ
jgi:hypothetical protein